MGEGRRAGEASGGAAHVISQLYYYVAAVIGVGLLLGGLVAFLFGVRTLILPEEYQQARDGLRQMLQALAFLLPGAATVWWHLREVRRRETPSAPGGFWGRALYFHLVALVALGFLLGGTVMVLSSAAEAAIPHCDPELAPLEPLEEPGVGGGAVAVRPGGGAVEVQPGGTHCYPTPAEAGRRALDGAIFLVAAGPVFWWHLRQGRRTNGSP